MSRADERAAETALWTRMIDLALLRLVAQRMAPRFKASSVEAEASGEGNESGRGAVVSPQPKEQEAGA